MIFVMLYCSSPPCLVDVCLFGHLGLLQRGEREVGRREGEGEGGERKGEERERKGHVHVYVCSIHPSEAQYKEQLNIHAILLEEANKKSRVLQEERECCISEAEEAKAR